MSGPKVIDIQALRRRQQRNSAAGLRELHALLAECLRHAEPGFQENAGTLLATLAGLREAQQWAELEAVTLSHRDFYRAEEGRLRERAAKSRAQKLHRGHRLRQGASQICALLQTLPASPERDRALREIAAAREDDDAALGAALSKAEEFAARIRGDAAAASHSLRLREMAAAYADPAALSLGAPSLPGAARDPDELRLERCFLLLGELEADAPDDAAIAQWIARARAAAAEASPDRRALLLDSLALDLTSHTRELRAVHAARAAFSAALGELENFASSEAHEWRAKISAAMEQPPAIEAALALAESARGWITRECAREDAIEQRAAVLGALAGLGYEVREGMAAAWAEQGRIVVHKPDEPQYGVEFSAPAQGSAMQARVVSAGESAARRDKEMEEKWCGDFARLRALLAEGGFETRITKAHAPGALPLKTTGRHEAPAAAERAGLRKAL